MGKREAAAEGRLITDLSPLRLIASGLTRPQSLALGYRPCSQLIRWHRKN
jgi:hypothetical protein